MKTSNAECNHQDRYTSFACTHLRDSAHVVPKLYMRSANEMCTTNRSMIVSGVKPVARWSYIKIKKNIGKVDILRLLPEYYA